MLSFLGEWSETLLFPSNAYRQKIYLAPKALEVLALYKLTPRAIVQFVPCMSEEEVVFVKVKRVLQH